MDSLVITGSTSKSIPLSITGLGLFVVPITTVVGYGVAITTKSASDFLKKKEGILRKKTPSNNTVQNFTEVLLENLEDNNTDQAE